MDMECFIATGSELVGLDKSGKSLLRQIRNRFKSQTTDLIHFDLDSVISGAVQIDFKLLRTLRVISIFLLCGVYVCACACACAHSHSFVVEVVTA